MILNPKDRFFHVQAYTVISEIFARVLFFTKYFKRQVWDVKNLQPGHDLPT